MSRRLVRAVAVVAALTLLGGSGLASCGLVKVNILSGGNPISIRLPEKQRPPPVTREDIRGTACATGELPVPRCLSYRSRTFDRLCKGPRAANFEADCKELRTDLPLPPR